MLRIAMVGKWHVHAVDYAKMVRERSEKALITCVWDNNIKRGGEWAKELDAEFIEDYDNLLLRDDVDGIIVDTETSLHHEIMIKAAKAKKHIFTEKVLAPTISECEDISKIVSENNVQFCISFPQMCRPEFVFVKQLVDSGKLGKINHMRVRNGHDGAVANWLPDYWYNKKDACGGVMLDLGCHPMYLSRWILGEPESISSTFSYITKREVEDSAVCTIKFKNNAISIVESSFVAPCSPYIMEVYGEKGSVFVNEKDIEIHKKENNQTIITVPKELPQQLPQAIDQWIKACETGGKCIFDMKKAIELTQLMQSAYKSAEINSTVFF